MKTFFQFLEAIQHQAGSQSTQVATTTGTYRKTAEKLLPKLHKNSKILDYGAGKGLGSTAMQNTFGKDHEVHSYEPAPKGWKPHFTKSDEIHHQYDAVVSHNVLNVLEPKLRSQVTHHALSLVKPGGHIVIGTRGYKGDVATAKSVTPSDKEDHAVWVHKKSGASYQRGFDGDELLNHMKEHDPEGKFEFHKIGGLAKNTIIGKRVKE